MARQCRPAPIVAGRTWSWLRLATLSLPTEIQTRCSSRFFRTFVPTTLLICSLASHLPVPVNPVVCADGDPRKSRKALDFVLLALEPRQGRPPKAGATLLTEPVRPCILLVGLGWRVVYAFPSMEATQVHHPARRRGSVVAGRARAARRAHAAHWGAHVHGSGRSGGASSHRGIAGRAAAIGLD